MVHEITHALECQAQELKLHLNKKIARSPTVIIQAELCSKWQHQVYFIILRLSTHTYVIIFGTQKMGIRCGGLPYLPRYESSFCKATSSKYRPTGILKFSICRYNKHIILLQATAKTEVHCKSRGNVLQVERQCAVSPTTIPVPGSGCHCGVPTKEVLWESCGSVNLLP